MNNYLTLPITMENNQSTILGDLCQGVTLCIFLRHWGCAECSFLLHRLGPRLQELINLEVRIILIGLGSVEGIATFRDKHHLHRDDVLIVTDPTLSIHTQAGLERGNSAVKRPGAIINRVKLSLQGYTNQIGDGDLLQQGGAILLDQKQSEIWSHRNPYFGDVLDPNQLINSALHASLNTSALS